MRRILWASAVAVLIGLPAAARAGEPRTGSGVRTADVVEAGCHRGGESKGGKCGSKCGKCGSKCDSGCDTCGSCGADDIRIGHLIETLLCGERVCDRRKAADYLDDYNWTLHPEIVAALEYAMQSDPHPGVRQKAADSLKDMRVSDPDAIGAMRFTQANDPNSRTRYKAKWGVIKGLKSQPPNLTFVSGYGPARSEHEPQRAPVLQRMPTPEDDDVTPRRPGGVPEPEIKDNKQTKSGVRGFISTVSAKVRSRS